MLPCAILGDSLAEGVAALRPECLSDTKVGITSAAYLAGHLVVATADRVLISLGVNDGAPTLATAEHPSKLRATLQARRVYRMLPAHPDATRALIEAVARTWGDSVIETRGFTGPDGLGLPVCRPPVRSPYGRSMAAIHSQSAAQRSAAWTSRHGRREWVPLAPRGPQGALLCSHRLNRRRPCPPPASRLPVPTTPETERAGQGARPADPASTGDATWPTMPNWTSSARG